MTFPAAASRTLRRAVSRTLGQGRTTIVQGVIHLVIFATDLFTTIVP